MMNKFSFLYILLLCSSQALCFADDTPKTTTVEQVVPASEDLGSIAISEGSLSPENERYIYNLIKHLDIQEPITVIRPSNDLKTISPLFYFEANFVPEYGMLFIDEERLNSLPDQEKLFFIGKSLIKIKNFRLFQQYQKTLESRQTLFSFASLGMSLLTFWKLKKSESFLHRWFVSLPLAALSGLFAKVLSQYLISYWAKSYDYKLMYVNAKETVERLHCLEGGIAYFQRLHNELSPYAQSAYWSEYYQGLEKVITYLESLKTKPEVSPAT